MKSEPEHMVAALSSSCPGEHELLAFAVGGLDATRVAALEAHLDACETCSRVMHAAMHDPAGDATVPVSGNEVATFQPGDVVAERYEIRRYVARGGMGEVYEAYDRHVGERVALKAMTSTKGGDEQGVRRMKAEVGLARRVSHPNVCRIHDLGTHQIPGAATPLHFLTMEFVDGETLGQRMRLGGALPFDEAHRLARELLLGLTAAHDSGILHRDFKSENVMLRPTSGGGETAVILDFGLARALDRENRASSVSRSLVGTFGYIAPELLEGAHYAPASDVYSFGVVWFEMLTGQMPFEATAALASVRPKTLQEGLPPPSRVNPAVPRDVDGLVLRCLARAPQYRFGAARDVLAALDHAGLGAPAPKRAQRLAIATVGVVLIAAAWQLTRPNLEPSPAAKPATKASARPTAPPPARVSSAAAVVKQPDPVLPPPAPRPTAAPSAHGAEAATSGRLARRALATPVKAVTPAPVDSAPSPAPAHSATPAVSTPGRRPKPEWENPFGAVNPEILKVGDSRSAT
jgi:hypothetical protein